MEDKVSIENAGHYVWGEVCDGWHLLQREDLSIIQERVPAGESEVWHYHRIARQFFYILAGEGVMALKDRVIILSGGEGTEIPPGTAHRFQNLSRSEVTFLVISMPATQSDRVNL